MFDVACLHIGGVERSGTGEPWLTEEDGAEQAGHSRPENAVFRNASLVHAFASIRAVADEPPVFEAGENRGDGFPRHGAAPAHAFMNRPDGGFALGPENAENHELKVRQIAIIGHWGREEG